MLTYKGGSRVDRGTYWNLRKGIRVDVTGEEILPGDAAVSYLKMPLAVMLLSGPIIGLIYAIFMPILGIATVVTLAARGVLRGIYNVAAKSVSFGWRPGNAYLSGQKKKEKKEEEEEEEEKEKK